MDEEIVAKFTELERAIRRDRKELRLQHRHLRQFLYIIAVIFSIVFAVITAGLGLFIGQLHATDKADFIDLKNELLQKAGPANVILQSVDKADLNGQTIPITVKPLGPSDDVDTKFAQKFSFEFITKNIGRGSSGPIWYKLYTDSSLNLGTISTDENNFAFEVSVDPAKLPLKELPGGGFSIYRLFTFPIVNQEVPKLSPPHRALFKIYFGDGQMVPYTIYFSGG